MLETFAIACDPKLKPSIPNASVAIHEDREITKHDLERPEDEQGTRNKWVVKMQE